MGSIFRKTAVRAVPAGATITRNRDGTETAKWMPRGARRSITAPVRALADGRKVIQQETGCYYAKYRDPDGLVQTISTGCRDRSSAEQRLAELERRKERIRAGVVTRAELAISDHLAVPLHHHVEDYVTTLGAGAHGRLTRRYLERLSQVLGWRTLSDLRRDDLELWLAQEGTAGRSARSRVGFQTAVVSFCNWLVQVKRLAINPFSRMPKARIEADRRRVRRALTPSDLERLVRAAQEAPGRPPLKSAIVAGQKGGRPEAKFSGRSRAVLYAFLSGTGLRLGEAQKLKVADLDLDARRPGLRLSGAATKNGSEAYLPLRADLVELLRSEVAERRPDDTVFDIPADLLRRFYGDLKRAGIDRFDVRGRRVDLHALRTTFGTHLAISGVPLATAQKLLRHADPKLTANVYTDAALLDLHGAVEALPAPASVVARVVPTGDTDGHFGASAGTEQGDVALDASRDGAKKNPTFRRVS